MMNVQSILHSRFDYGIKRECALQYKSLGCLMPSTQWDYLHHLSIWNNFKEDHKTTAECFLSDFSALATTYNASMAPPISIDRSSLSLVNGIHRLAVHDSFDILPSFKLVDSPYRYNYSFFKNYINQSSSQQFPESLIQRMAVYETFHKDLNAVILFPKAIAADNGRVADQIVNEQLSVNCRFDYTVPVSLIPLLTLHLYPQHPWIWKNNTIQTGAVYHKSNEILNRHGLQHVRIYLVGESSTSLVDIKAKIRHHYALGNDSVHTTDQSKECSLLFEFLQGLKLLSKSFPAVDITSPSIHSFFSAPIYRHYTARDRYLHYSVVSGTTILDLLGCGIASDLDFIYPKIPTFPDGHQSYDYLFGINTDCFPLNLRDTVSILGYRCLQPDTILNMKRNRNEPKDRLTYLFSSRQ